MIDFLTRREGVSDLVRIVRGMRGRLAMRSELIVRFEYGAVVPWVSRQDDSRREMTAGPDRLVLDTSIPLRGENFRTVGEFEITAGEEVAFALSWTRSLSGAGACAGGRRSGADRIVLVAMDRSLQADGRMVPGGFALAIDAEGARPLGDWRHRRCRHDVAAGKAGRHATGTIGSAGCAMPRLRCMRSSARGSRGGAGLA